MKRILLPFLSVILSFSLILCASNLCFASSAEKDGDNYKTDSLKITDIVPDKSRYEPDDTAKLTVTVKNESNQSQNGEITVYISHLENIVDTLTKPVNVTANETLNTEIEWKVPNNDYTGYYVKATLGSSSASTAIDCSSDISMFPRYGYVGEYDGDEQKTEQTANTVSLLSTKYHINAYQFYDWQWRHDDYVKYDENGDVAKEWDDLFNRKISSDTVKAYIAAARCCNAESLAYVQSYTAREDYEQHGVSPEDGLYWDKNHQDQWVCDLGSTKLYQFNPASANWQKKMISEYRNIINDMGFDGLQIDQLGGNGDMYSYNGELVDYGKGFGSFVNAAKSALVENNPKRSTVTFNMVGGWPSQYILNGTDTDFNFSELWNEHGSYDSVRQWVEKAVNEGKKSFVLAAYLNYYDNPGDVYEAEDGELSGGAAIASNHSGYSGSGFVDHFSDKGAAVTFTVDVPEDGMYSIVPCYSNGTSTTATRNLYIDGSKVHTFDMGSSGSWEYWATRNIYLNIELTKGKHTLKIAYDDDNTGAVNLDKITLGTFSENTVRIADAAIAASGASHIELGAKEGNITMLSNEYYPNSRLMLRSNHLTALKNHYDFITAYENLLYGNDIRFTTDNRLKIDGISVNRRGDARKLWYITRENDDYDILHLINLTAENDNDWRNSTSTPETKTDLKAKYYLDGNEIAQNVYLASPDIDNCESTEIEFTEGLDDDGRYIEFTVPSLEYWDMIYIRKSTVDVNYGDVNQDSQINLLDLIALRKYLAKWNIDIDYAAADCNADGKVNLLDLILLRKYLAKWNIQLGAQK